MDRRASLTWAGPIRAWRGNGVNFQGSLQAFMDSFVLSSLKKDKEARDKLQHLGMESGEVKAKRGENGEEKADVKPSKGKPEKSQYEPLDLSVRPDSASLPGSSVTIQDNVAWHGCLFCSFTTSSVELMALHLQANHLGKAKRKESGILDMKGMSREPMGEHSSASKTRLAPATLHPGNESLSTKQGLHVDRMTQQETGKEAVGEQKSAAWSNHMDPANGSGFQSDFFKQFSMYDGHGGGGPGPQSFGGPCTRTA
ncbi:hypothetical protein SKAU_G00181860 [Synaphobranchus kaupii]|uniref:Zinc finger protein 536 n=1 Tax=Synaphobranchus kaupii TaxID=118154 RepID=A0A9Q1FBW8_SYNKA|nr:hypothetical protein SKAU_G00181860 [Synaphobranchus kaupii]